MLSGRTNLLCGKLLSKRKLLFSEMISFVDVCQRIKEEVKILCSEWCVPPKLAVIEVRFVFTQLLIVLKLSSRRYCTILVLKYK